MIQKAKIKIVTDILMTAAMLFLMGYQFWGEIAHEWAGAGIFLLFITHHVLNSSWYRGLVKWKYTLTRILMIAINFLLLAAMLALMYSSFVLSRHVFAFLPAAGGMALARRLHILGAFWGFILMSLHLGLHWGMLTGFLRKKMISSWAFRRYPVILKASVWTAGSLIAACGLYVFWKRDFISYLFLRSEFVFMDYEEPVVLFYLDHLALMGFFVFISDKAFRLADRMNGRKRAGTSLSND